MERIRIEVLAALRAAQIIEAPTNTQAVSASMPNNSSSEQSTVAAAVIRASAYNLDPIKLVGDLAANFPERSKFSGAGEPTLAVVLNQYSDAILEMNLTHSEQRHYCHLLLTREANGLMTTIYEISHQPSLMYEYFKRNMKH
jgi:hypothetical protein